MEMNFKASILIVDGVSDNLVLMEELLQERYHVRLARSGEDALRIAQQAPRPDLIVLGGALADSDSLRVFQGLKCQVLSADTPVIMLIPDGGAQLEERAWRDGVADVVQQPFVAGALLARVATQLRLRAAGAMLRDQHSHFEHLVAERVRDAGLMQDATVLAMAVLAESRDPGVGQHLLRTQHYVMALARELRFVSACTAELTNENITLLHKAAPLHDIGKVGVPDAVLLKPGKLSDSEFELMKLHTVYGRDAIAGVERTLGGTNGFLRYAREIAYSHQEKWDGSGYPQGLAGDAIPLSARLMAVADVYDALITARAYRPAFTHETAVELIRQGRGEHFDPDVVDAMLAIEERFKAIAAEFPPP
ncbi:HD-GYP domain-containing protein [Massilia pseudoviolaceinigra]|uniref:HD-GYP domain-containing protein n=1 Tax=Massilia pseudoviolaceinigra TaxID=3057165 RepID=UPI002796C1C5|nr:HD domain-containing phosphohydrolase [Massilia sp. CCM 9206]MDQ1923007.1 HD domain-containing protein [Massilia sp. CCM 9206]